MRPRLGAALLRRALRGATPTRGSFETSAYEQAKYDATIARARRPPLRQRRSRSAARSACSPSGSPRTSTTCSRSTSSERGARPRRAARVPRRRASSGARSRRSSRTAPFDLIVCLRGPLLPRRARVRARRSTRSAHADGTLLAVHWRRPTPQLSAHGRRGPRRASRRASARRRTARAHRRLPPRPLRRMRLVIVGGGPAALAAARGYREAGGDGDVTLVTPELDRPLPRARRSRRSSCAASSTRPSCRSRPTAWYADHGVELRLGARGRRRSTRARTRRARAAARRCPTTPACSPPAPSRSACPSPARPRKACCCCAASPTPACCATAPRRPRRRIVIGSGFIGCEAAASLAMRGLEVTLVSDEAIPHAAAARRGGGRGGSPAGWRSSASTLRLGERVGGDRRRTPPT